LAACASPVPSSLSPPPRSSSPRAGRATNRRRPRPPAAGTGTAGQAAANACTKDQLKTRTPGTLTVATDKPAFPPYFEDNDPKNGKGFDSAVAHAIAQKLGFSKGRGEVDDRAVQLLLRARAEEVRLRRQPDLDHAGAGQAGRPHDAVLHRPAGARRADVLRRAKATTLAAVADAKLGVQIGTTSLDAVQQVVKPSAQPKVFNDSNDVVTALKQRQVDAVVVDLPTAIFLTTAQVPSATIVGQFSAPGGDTWGALLEKDSPLCRA
jgi:polar amino acid transport system substrate-binding protein